MKLPKVRWIVVLTIFTMLFVVAGAVTALAGNPNAACDQTPYENTSGNGANHSGAYDDTCDGSPSENGNGNGNATGKPCAGCVGNADEKNPPGQDPDGSDANSGYECDENSGVGKSNPAHTGCEASGQNPPEEEENPSGSTPGAEVLGTKFLAVTGSPVSGIATTGALLLVLGIGMRVRGRRIA